MSQPLFSLDELAQAETLVRQHMPVTPAYEWPLLSSHSGVTTVVKHENCTPTGAFKVRGGFVFMDRLRRERPEVSGVVSASIGNHGMSLAYAGRLAGVNVIIFVPETTDAERVASLEAQGAEVRLTGADFEEAREASMVCAADEGLEPVPPFHRDLVIGVATYAKELFEQAGPLDVVYVPVGMGSGMCGLITVRDLLGLDTKIVGVSAAGAPAQKLTFEAGSVVSTGMPDTFAAGVATRQPDPEASAIIAAGGDSFIAVDDADTAEAMRQLWRTTHHLAEPAGAIATAALITDADRWAGQRAAVVMTGANVDTAGAHTALAG